MVQEAPNVSLSERILDLLKQGQKKEQVEHTLLAEGLEEYFVRQMVAEAVKLKNTKTRALALMLILAGAFLCFLSFLLTITSSFSHSSFEIVLYGFTSIGIILVFAGLVKIF